MLKKELEMNILSPRTHPRCNDRGLWIAVGQCPARVCVNQRLGSKATNFAAALLKTVHPVSDCSDRNPVAQLVPSLPLPQILVDTTGHRARYQCHRNGDGEGHMPLELVSIRSGPGQGMAGPTYACVPWGLLG